MARRASRRSEESPEDPALSAKQAAGPEHISPGAMQAVPTPATVPQTLEAVEQAPPEISAQLTDSGSELAMGFRIAIMQEIYALDPGLALSLIRRFQDSLPEEMRAVLASGFDDAQIIAKMHMLLDGHRDMADLLTSGQAGEIVLMLPDEEAARNRMEGYIQDMEALQESFLSAGISPHFQVMRRENDPTVIAIVNNWYLPFTPEERRTLAGCLERATSLDAGGMQQVFAAYRALAELAPAFQRVRASMETFGVGAEPREWEEENSVARELRETLSSYEALKQQVLFTMQAVLSGSPDAATELSCVGAEREDCVSSLETLYSRIVNAFREFNPAYGDNNFARMLGDIDLAEFGEPPERWDTGLSFSQLELGMFASIYRRYQDVGVAMRGDMARIQEEGPPLPPIPGIAEKLAAIVLGLGEGMQVNLDGERYTVPEFTAQDAALYTEFKNLHTVLQLFAAKAEFLEISSLYFDAQRTSEELSRGEEPAEHMWQRMYEFEQNEEFYLAELNRIRPLLLAYGEYMERTLSSGLPLGHFASSDDRASYVSRTFTGALTFTEELRQMSGPPRRVDIRGEIEAGLDVSPGFSSLLSPMYDSPYRGRSLYDYMHGLRRALGAIQERESDVAIEQHLGELARNGNFFDWASLYVRDALSSWGPIVQIGGAAVGCVIGGVRGAWGGPGGVIAGCGYGGWSGFRTASTVLAVTSIIPVISTVQHLGGEGLMGDLAQNDIRQMGYYFLSAGAGWRGATGRVTTSSAVAELTGARVLSAAEVYASTISSGVGTAAFGGAAAADLSREDWLGAAFDAVAFVAGGRLFISGVGGIMEMSLARAGIPADYAIIGTNAGLETMHFSSRIGAGGAAGAARAAPSASTLGSALVFPYSPMGVIDMYAGIGIFEVILHRQNIVEALSRSENWLDRVVALQEYLGSTYSSISYTLPAVTVAFSVVLEGLPAAARAAGRRATGRVMVGVETSNPALTGLAGQAGVGEQSLSLAREFLGADAVDSALAARLYGLSAGEARVAGRSLTRDEIMLALDAPVEGGGQTYWARLGRRADEFAERLAGQVNESWADLRLIAGGDRAALERLSISRQGRIQRMLGFMWDNKITTLMLAGAGASAAIAGPEVAYRTELVQATQRMRDTMVRLYHENESALSRILSGSVPGFDIEVTDEQSVLAINSAIIVANRIEEMIGAGAYDSAHSWAEGLARMVPDRDARIGLVIAASIAMLRAGEADSTRYPNSLESFIGNITRFLSSQPGMDWTGMGVGDFFLAANYYLAIGRPSLGRNNPPVLALSQSVSGFRQGFSPTLGPSEYMDMEYNYYTLSGYPGQAEEYRRNKAAEEMLGDPQFARVAIASLYSAHFVHATGEAGRGARASAQDLERISSDTTINEDWRRSAVRISESGDPATLLRWANWAIAGLEGGDDHDILQGMPVELRDAWRTSYQSFTDAQKGAFRDLLLGLMAYGIDRAQSIGGDFRSTLVAAILPSLISLAPVRAPAGQEASSESELTSAALIRLATLARESDGGTAIFAGYNGTVLAGALGGPMFASIEGIQSITLRQFASSLASSAL